MMIDRAALEDSRLSWKARGILAYLLSKPDDWEVSVKEIWKSGKEGRNVVQACMKELEEVGYAELKTIRDRKGKVVGKQWIIREQHEETPTNRQTEIRVFGASENNPTDKPKSGSTTNTNSIHSNSTPHFANAERKRKKEVPQKADEFDTFWNTYGYKKDKTAAQKAWRKLTEDEKSEALKCAPIYASETVTADADRNHWKPRRKFPATWLNAKGWIDYQEQAEKAVTEQATVTPYDADYNKYLDWVRGNCPLITAGVKYLSKPQYILYREMGEKVRIGASLMFKLLTRAHTEFEDGNAKASTVYEHFTQVISEHRKTTQTI